jgi:hypothetical protein
VSYEPKGAYLEVAAATGAVTHSTVDPAAGMTTDSAFDATNGITYLFYDDYILRPYFLANASFGSKVLVNLDNCTGASSCFQEFHWHESTQSIIAVTLGYNGKNGVVLLNPKNGLVVKVLAQFPQECGLVEGGAAFSPESKEDAAKFYIVLDCISPKFIGAGVFSYDLTTGANKTMATFNTSEITSPIVYHPLTGIIGFRDNSLVKFDVPTGKMVPFVENLPGVVSSHCLAASSSATNNLLYGTAIVRGGGHSLFTVDLAKAAVTQTVALAFSLEEIAVLDTRGRLPRREGSM